MINTLKNNKILILGFGREGRDTLRFLHDRFPNKEIGIADKAEEEIKESGDVKTFFGENYLDAIQDYEIIIKSPGIPFSLIKEFEEEKIITSQTDIFLNIKHEKVIGVTGTKGKSTTCLSIYNILNNKLDKPVYLLGNIGKPVLSFVDKEGFFIYELSSFQLQTANTSPHVAVLLNIFKDHLDQHENFDKYLSSKANITKFQKKEDILIYNKKDQFIKNIAKKSKAKKIKFDPKDRIPNSAVYLQPILKVVSLFGVSEKETIKNINKIDFLPHRLEFVGKYQNISFFNDSAATIPEAAVEAISNVDNLKTLITGGVDKGGDYCLLAEKIIKSDIETLILFPVTGQKIESELKEISNKLPKIIHCNSMEQAVKEAYNNTKFGSCLLSPASSSFNMFSSYKDRGNQFKENVKKYGQK
ncbi:MAG: Mur ligase family protein [Patescibacteria group bacterium]